MRGLLEICHAVTVAKTGREDEDPAKSAEERAQLGGWAEQMSFPTLHRLRSEEHTSELQSLMRISYAVFCLKKTNRTHTKDTTPHKDNIHMTLSLTTKQ